MNDAFITEEELHSLGIELPADELKKLVEGLNDKIDELVGEEILDSLTPDDVDKLAALEQSASEEELADWIIARVPDYPEIMENNKDIVLGDFVEELLGENAEDSDDEEE